MRLEQLGGAEINHAKKMLADEATTLAHGRDVLGDIHDTIAKLFENQSGGDLSSLPTIVIPMDALNTGIPVVDLFCQLGFAASKGEARRLIQGGGARLNDSVITDIALSITQENLNTEGFLKLSMGKKKHGVVKS